MLIAAKHLRVLLTLTIFLSACSALMDPVGETEGIWLLRTLGGASLPVQDGSFRGLVSDTLVLGGAGRGTLARHVAVWRRDDGTLVRTSAGGRMRGDIDGGDFIIDFRTDCEGRRGCVNITYGLGRRSEVSARRRGDVLWVDRDIPGSEKVYHRFR